MAKSYRPPKWAAELVTEVCRTYGKLEPRVIWKWCGRDRTGEALTFADGSSFPTRLPGSRLTSGTCYPDRIVIRAGKIERDQKLVLLHELAHWTMPAGEHHSLAFWNRAWELYERYMPRSLAYAYKRERGYRDFAGVVYHRRRGK